MLLSVKSEVPLLIFNPFRPTVKLLDPHVPLASIMVTSSPVEAAAGKVTVITVEVVFAKICAPATVV